MNQPPKPSDAVKQSADSQAAVTDNETKHTARYFRLAIVSFLGNILLVYVAFFHFPQTQYLSSVTAAAACTLPSLDKPHYTPGVVSDFAIEAAMGIYDYNYSNYNRQITGVANRYFTPELRNAFLPAFGDSENLKRVIAEYLTVFPTRDGMPAQVEKSGLKDGAVFWIVNVPIVAHYASGAKNKPEKVLAAIEVIQVDPQINVRGLAIDNIVLKQML